MDKNRTRIGHSNVATDTLSFLDMDGNLCAAHLPLRLPNVAPAVQAAPHKRRCFDVTDDTDHIANYDSLYLA